MLFDGFYELQWLEMTNNIPNVHGTDLQRTISVDSNPYIIPQGNYTLTELAATIQGLVTPTLATFTCTSNLIDYTLTYADPAPFPLQVDDLILQEVLGVATLTTAASIVSSYCNMAPFSYVGIQLQGEISRPYTRADQKYSIHITTDTFFGDVIKYSFPQQVLFISTYGLHFTVVSRGHTFDVPYIDAFFKQV